MAAGFCPKKFSFQNNGFARVRGAAVPKLPWLVSKPSLSAKYISTAPNTATLPSKLLHHLTSSNNNYRQKNPDLEHFYLAERNKCAHSVPQIGAPLLADRTATQYDRLLASSCRPSVSPSVRLSVCLSVTLCIVALSVGVQG